VTEEEFGELLEFVRAAVRSQGRADLDELLVGSRRIDAVMPQGQLLAYLEGLRDEIALRADRTTRQMMLRLREIRTENDDPILGVTVDIMDEDVAVYGARSIDISGSPELDSVVSDLNELIAQLRESGDQ